MNHFIELTLAGLTRGGIYALIAVGYTMVYGIIGLINFAHGEIYMLGAFVGLTAAGVATAFGFSDLAILALALTLAVVYAAAYGYTAEKVAYRPLRGAPRLSALISAIGMSIFLQNFVLLAQGSEFKTYPNLIEKYLGKPLLRRRRRRFVFSPARRMGDFNRGGNCDDDSIRPD